jgi:DNA-directed RNA polymerase subunit M/transcription elongation factor TFIIS
MVIARHKCDKCLEFMRVDKIGENYFMICQNCAKEKEERDGNK